MSCAKWQMYLSERVLNRLADCVSTKGDMVELTRAFHEHDGKARGFEKVDSLVYMLEWVLDWNSGTWDYTDEEFDSWLEAI